LATVISKEIEKKNNDKNTKDNFVVRENNFCRNCRQNDTCVKVAIPYVLRYLTNELAGMNIKMKFTIK
jgi:DNA-directed RNA polymerase beta subunit